MRIVAELGLGLGEERDLATGVERLPVETAIGRLEHTARRQRDVHVRRVARIDDDGVQHRPVGRVLLGPLGPRRPHRMVVPTVDRIPRCATVAADEQALRRAAGVPHTGFVGVPWRQPEHRLHAALELVARSKRGRRCFCPRRAQVVGMEKPSGRGARSASQQQASCPIRGPSSTTCCAMCPRNIGSLTVQLSRDASPVRVNTPLRVPTRSTPVVEPMSATSRDDRVGTTQGSTILKTAPVGSAACARRPYGVSSAPMTIEPPSSTILASAASVSSTPK